MINDELKVKVANQTWSDGYQVLLREGDSVATRVVMEIGTEGKIVEPTFTLSQTAAQELMDNLWQCGLRPSEGSGSAGSLRATEKHLTDMRKITGNLLEINLDGSTPV